MAKQEFLNFEGLSLLTSLIFDKFSKKTHVHELSMNMIASDDGEGNVVLSGTIDGGESSESSIPSVEGVKF